MEAAEIFRNSHDVTFKHNGWVKRIIKDNDKFLTFGVLAGGVCTTTYKVTDDALMMKGFKPFLFADMSEITVNN